MNSKKFGRKYLNILKCLCAIEVLFFFFASFRLSIITSFCVIYFKRQTFDNQNIYFSVKLLLLLFMKFPLQMRQIKINVNIFYE